MQRMRICLILLIIFSAVSCTFNEPRLRPEPIAAALGPTGWRLQGETLTLNDGLEFRCVEWHSWTNYPSQWILEAFTGWHSTMDECVYLTVDPKTVIGGPQPSDPGFLNEETTFNSVVPQNSGRSPSSEVSPVSTTTPGREQIEIAKRI